MAKKLSQKQRAKIVERCIRDVWESLDTHLPYTHDKHPDGADFHKKCVADYAKTIERLSKLF